MTEAPEPEDKLDATAAVVVNGPEDAPLDWHAVDWRRVEDDVRRLRQRIITASEAALLPAYEPEGACLSRVPENGHALVLRRARHSNVSGLPVQTRHLVERRYGCRSHRRSGRLVGVNRDADAAVPREERSTAAASLLLSAIRLLGPS